MSKIVRYNLAANLQRAPKLGRPRNYKIILDNGRGEALGCDVIILTDVFNMDLKTAIHHMFEATATGQSVVFESTFEVVETKMLIAQMALRNLVGRDENAHHVHLIARPCP